MNRLVVVMTCASGLALLSAVAPNFASAQQNGSSTRNGSSAQQSAQDEQSGQNEQSGQSGQNEQSGQSGQSAQNAQGDRAARLAHGKAVFDKWCAPCHGEGPGKPGTAALQALYQGEKPALLEQRMDLAPAVTKTFVRNGVSVMPFFRKTEISDTDLDALAAYLAQ